MIYITYIDLNSMEHSGIKKKVMSQIIVFQKYFHCVYYTAWCGRMLYLMKDNKIIDKELAFSRQKVNEILCGWLEEYKIKRTYIRYNLSDKWFIHFLKVQKEKCIKSVLEIPTYPYDGEMAEGLSKIEDTLYREQLYRYVDFVTTNSNSKYIFNIRCIQLLNGVNLDENPIVYKKQKNGKIVLIGVSTLAKWHGYERILEGLFYYYQNKGDYEILFKIVGEGPEKQRYISMVTQYDLGAYVEFLGKLEGESLEQQYNMSDLAVSSLGLYKTGIQEVAPIKGSEYCARGIPFICGYDDMRFPESVDFIMHVTNDSKPIDMYQIINFYQRINSKQTYQEEMRNYAIKHLTWDRVLSSVIEVLI